MLSITHNDLITKVQSKPEIIQDLKASTDTGQHLGNEKIIYPEYELQ